MAAWRTEPLAHGATSVGHFVAGWSYRKWTAPDKGMVSPSRCAWLLDAPGTGRFADDLTGQLKKVLASMPLRARRTDEVTPLSPTRTTLRWRPGREARSP